MGGRARVMGLIGRASWDVWRRSSEGFVDWHGSGASTRCLILIRRTGLMNCVCFVLLIGRIWLEKPVQTYSIWIDLVQWGRRCGV